MQRENGWWGGDAVKRYFGVGRTVAWWCALAFLPRPEAAIAAPRNWSEGKVILGDYDSEPRRPDGRVDTARLLGRLKELHATTYYWLVWHAATDWEDLKGFLPGAEAAGIEVWAYLVPPTESPPHYGTQYSEPFRLDYQKWGEEIARLSKERTNLVGWVIDDFYANHGFFTPAYVAQMQARAKKVNPKLRFLPLMYFQEISRRFVEEYRKAIDGVVVAYPQSREEIEHAWAVLNDAALVQPGELAFPWYMPSQAGDFVEVSQRAKVRAGQEHRLRFHERDDFTGPTEGYHFKQLLVNGKVVWEEDVGGGNGLGEDVSVDLAPALEGATNATIGFRILDKKGVSNFGVRWSITGVEAEGLALGATMREPELWEVEQKGPFEAGFGKRSQEGRHSFQVPFIVMTAGQASEFKLRHGEPTSPDRMAEWVKMCLEAYNGGKCDGVVTYCLDKSEGSRVFELVAELFGKTKSTQAR